MKSAANQRRGVTANGRDYREVFLRQVHWLLQLGYERMVPVGFSEAEEEDISGELRRHIRRLLYDEQPARWMKHYDLHNEDPEDETCRARQVKVRRGKDRPVIDLRFVSSRTRPRRRFCIEAKRLYRGDSVAQYVGHSGMGCFLNGTYAKGDTDAGMLGFVQKGKPEDWFEKIEAKVEAMDSAEVLSSGRRWEPLTFRNGPCRVGHSRHRRLGPGGPVEVFHSLLPFY